MDKYVTNSEPANKQSFGFDSKPPGVPEVKNTYDAMDSFRELGPPEPASQLGAPEAQAEQYRPVAPGDTDQRNELHFVPHKTDVSNTFGSVKKGTTGLDGFWNTPGRSAARNSDALGG